MTTTDFRTIAIIAHVDHGKTTLLDHLLRQSGTLVERGKKIDRVMDSNPQERERGITILAKVTAIAWHGHKIQIVDTPGHQDFGGEVERVLRMCDSVLLIVDAVEGPMPQTRYVTRKALAHGLRPIVVINKMDRPEARPDYVLNGIFDLFISLGATDEQLDFPVLYASARDGWASNEVSETGTDLEPLFQSVIDHAPFAQASADDPLRLQVATLDYSEYLGRIAIGRVHNGFIERGLHAVCCRRDGSELPFRVTKLFGFSGLERIDRQRADAGEIIALAGIDEVMVGETICIEGQADPMPLIPIDEPTISMLFGINTAPTAGTEGKYVTTRQLRERLDRELEHNVGLRLETLDRKDMWRLYGRGTLHLSVLFESMRREGYEMSVGQPQVVFRDGQEPFEQVTVTAPSEMAGIVIEKLTKRHGVLTKHEVDEQRIATLELTIPSRGLIGYRSQFLTDTRGEGVIYHSFSHYDKTVGPIRRRENGAIISMDPCETVAYGLNSIQERGHLFVGAGEKVYRGQVVGEHARSNDLVVNPGKSKHLSNMRTAGKDANVRLVPPIRFSLEEALEWIGDDELVELTPTSIRLRKTVLEHLERRRSDKAQADAVA